MNFLSLKIVRYYHERAMNAMGEEPSPFRGANVGLGQLDSAITRPINYANYENPDADVVKLGALLAVSISQAQAYVDGNKRTAYLSLLAFLRLNGWTMDLDDGGKAMAARLEKVAERTREDFRALGAATLQFERWLRRHCSALPPKAKSKPNVRRFRVRISERARMKDE